jgi:hypothetical protein
LSNFISIGCSNFINVALQNPIDIIDLSDVSFENPSNSNEPSMRILEIKKSLSDDRIYKFVMSTNSSKFELLNKSFEWTAVESAVEVYKLPTDLFWPTMYCTKQSTSNDFFCPEFIIRRMNHMHRHRVNATLNRLWYRPNDYSHLRTMIMWVGSPGSGKSVAVSEIILECILKLDKIGKAKNGTNWQFFFRINKSIIKFYYNSEINRVSQKLYNFSSVDLMLFHLQGEYVSNMNSFVIYELNEDENCPIIDMPFLLSTSCRDLDQNFKHIEKSVHTKYLYDPLIDFEFKFFLDVCFAFGRLENVHPKAEYIRRFNLQGGILRKLLSPHFVEPVKLVFSSNDNHIIALKEMAKCSPKNINSTVNSIVGVFFNFSISLESDTYILFKNEIKQPFHFLPESIPFEFYHLSENWMVSILSEHIALAISNMVSFPTNLEETSSLALFQIQELMSIYGGILKVPNESYSLSEGFKMSSWSFYKCCSEVYHSAITNHKSSSKSLKKHPNLSFAKPIEFNVVKSLIGLLPNTNKIWRFYGQYLKIPFQQLSTSYVYKSSVHNGPVFDALAANPADKQLFLFQMTLNDLLLHPVKICAFIDVLSCLRLNPSDVEEIYFFMIISAHDNIDKQHFFQFELEKLKFNACFFKEYTSKDGLSALKTVISMNSDGQKYKSDLIGDVEAKKMTVNQMNILKTIGGIYHNDSFYNIRLSSELYNKLFLFLEFAEKIHSYICRSQFMQSSVSE